MKILVIGSKGFIGSHCFQYFSQKSHDVYGCDVVVDYNQANYFQVDATNSSFDEVFGSVGIDIAINCSGAASVPDSFVHPLRDFNQNVQNVYRLLEAIRKHSPACKFINLSSAAVYGNPVALPVAEKNIINPLSPYGWHKHYAEQICREAYIYFKIPTCSVRIFSAFGHGLRKQIFWDWFQKTAKGEHISLYGTGNESRDFIYIDDVVLALDIILTQTSFQGEAINVGNGKEVFIKDAMEIFQRARGVAFTYAFNGHVRTGDPLNWRADISMLRSFGFKQQVSFEEGIKRYIEWAEKE